MEAARAVIADGFERRGYEQIVARTDPGNMASLGAIARLAFVAQDDGTYRLSRAQWRPQEEGPGATDTDDRR
jgi:RimJ/RimL family protein N-acetyltransferase